MASELMTTARAVFATFAAGVAGDRDAMKRFIDDMHDDVTLVFPVLPGDRPVNGEHYGREAVRAFWDYICITGFPGGLFLTVDREWETYDSVAFLVTSTGVTGRGMEMIGHPIITFFFRDGRLALYREYFPPTP